MELTTFNSYVIMLRCLVKHEDFTHYTFPLAWVQLWHRLNTDIFRQVMSQLYIILPRTFV